MDYITVKEESEKWGVTPRRVNYCCAGGCILDAVKIAGVGMLTKYVEKPLDKRRKENKTTSG